MKTIGVVSTENPFTDRRAWSGTKFKICEGMQRAGYNVVWIRAGRKWASKLGNIIFHLFAPKGNKFRFTSYAARLNASFICKKQLSECDYLFFASDQHTFANYLKTSKPLVAYSDATFSLLTNYYYPRKTEWVFKNSDRCERKSLQRCRVVLMSSDWAADSCVRDYGVDSQKVHVLEFGANLDDEHIISASPYKGEQLNVLFSGVEWKRKGASVAIDAVRLLNQQGINARLSLVGIRPDVIPTEYQNLPFVEYVGFLNKNKPDEYQRFAQIIAQSHITILPTIAECSPIALIEASAFGLPIFTHDTGGIANYVENGVNGYRLPLGCGAEGFASAIANAIKSNELAVLSQGGRELYASRTNWTVWSQRFRQIMDEAGLGAE